MWLRCNRRVIIIYQWRSHLMKTKNPFASTFKFDAVNSVSPFHHDTKHEKNIHDVIRRDALETLNLGLIWLTSDQRRE